MSLLVYCSQFVADFHLFPWQFCPIIMIEIFERRNAMIGKHIEGFLFENPAELMLEASCVATVGTENTLLHALMVLSSVG